MPVAEADLHRDLAATKEHASGLNAQVKALRRELGGALDAAARVPGLEAEAGKFAALVAERDNEIKSLGRALESASARADAGDAAIRAGKAIADGLKALGAL